MKHLRLFEEFGESSKKEFALFTSWLARRDFDLYDGFNDFKNKFHSIMDENLSIEDKATKICDYLEEKWSLYSGYEEAHQKLVDILSKAI